MKFLGCFEHRVKDAMQWLDLRIKAEVTRYILHRNSVVIFFVGWGNETFYIFLFFLSPLTVEIVLSDYTDLCICFKFYMYLS